MHIKVHSIDVIYFTNPSDLPIEHTLTIEFPMSGRIVKYAYIKMIHIDTNVVTKADSPSPVRHREP